MKISGTIHGERIELALKPKQIGAFPATPADHFDIYHNGNLIYIYPENPRMTVKWACYLDNLMAKKRAAASSSVAD